MEFDETDRILIGGELVSGSARLDVLNPVTGQVSVDFTQ